MTIATRIALGGGLLLAFTLLTAVLGLAYLSQTQHHLDEMAGNGQAKLRLVGEMRDAVNAGAIAVRNLVLLTDEKDMEAEATRIAEARETYAAASAKLGSLITSGAEKKLYARVAEAKAEAEPILVRATEFAVGNPIEATRVLVEEMRPAQARWLEMLAAFVELEGAAANRAVQEADAAYARAQFWMVALALLALGTGGLIGWSIVRSIALRVNEAVSVAQSVAAGDLTCPIRVDSLDELGELQRALKRMNISLADIVKGVRSGSDAISLASSEIASGNADLSKRTEAQAGALEETASSMEQLTCAVRHNADNAQLADRLADATAGIAERGGRLMSDVVDNMSSIRVSSDRIAEIVGVIDSIAFQINLLALNAAVEAARAGEQGRGFAVVAGEVRRLAERSATAAREIKALIADSVDKVEDGSRLVDEAGQTMTEIVGSIQRVAGIMGEIAEASAEQRAGIEQVNRAILQMDDVTQQNAALVEQAAAAAQSLQTQARELVESVSVFDVPADPVEQIGPHVRLIRDRELPLRRPKLRLVAPGRRAA